MHIFTSSLTIKTNNHMEIPKFTLVKIYSTFKGWFTFKAFFAGCNNWATVHTQDPHIYEMYHSGDPVKRKHAEKLAEQEVILRHFA